uniref:MD-2-related lipid-recognition domain-containing protein n=1 Tax=Globodera rostochiensis TaxID=31243 RepID=A0A914GUZ5_GLORO
MGIIFRPLFVLLAITFLCIYCEDGRIFHQIRYKNCKSQFEVVHVGVLDCVRKDRCDFVRGKEYQIQIGFKPDRRVEQLKTAVWSHLGDAHGALTKFHMENENACIGSNITCPLEPGRTYWYRQSVSILREFPEVDVQVNWLLTSPEVAPRKDQKFPLQREVCVKFLGKVIGEEN